MSLLEFRIEVDASDVMRASAALADAMRGLAPVMERTSATMLTSVQQNFSTESAGTPYNGHAAPAGFWADLAASTKRTRAARGTWPGKKLNDRGRLLASLQRFSTATEAGVGTSVAYARFLHSGTKRIPARPFLVLQQRDVDEIERLVREHVEQALKK
jgi:phage virion morphogenesis protein